MQIDQKTRKEQLMIAEQKAVELFDETIIEVMWNLVSVKRI